MSPRPSKNDLGLGFAELLAASSTMRCAPSWTRLFGEVSEHSNAPRTGRPRSVAGRDSYRLLDSLDSRIAPLARRSRSGGMACILWSRLACSAAVRMTSSSSFPFATKLQSGIPTSLQWNSRIGAPPTYLPRSLRTQPVHIRAIPEDWSETRPDGATDRRPTDRGTPLQDPLA